MTCQIPQKIEYKEKIIFGLTFGQLLYALIFAPLVIALLVKPPFHWAIRVTLALFPAGIAALFMFTKIPQEMLNMLKWQKWKHVSLITEDKQINSQMRKFLPIKEIKDGEVHL